MEDGADFEDGKRKKPTLGQALIPVFVMVALLASSVVFFADDSSYGPNQIALILSAMVGAIVGIRNGFTWKELQDGMVHGVSLAMGAIFILLVVGSLIGTWILAGIVPTMIYYGLQILSPSIFFAACCIISALVALATGSSWTTAGTVGIALVGIASAFELNLGIAAGAIISGAYFGDKLSPLSDTTNLAPAMAGTDLFTHIRHMLYTTLPSFVIALILFTIIGFMGDRPAEAGGLDEMLTALSSSFNIGWYLLLPVVAVLFMIYKKVPAFPALLIGALTGGVFAMIFQQSVVMEFAGETGLPLVFALLKGFWMAMFDGFAASTGNASLDELLSRGGMSSMLNTIWLIVSAMMFGAVMEKTGMLQELAGRVLGMAKSTGGLITATVATSIGANIIASDQYIAIVVPGRMYRAEFAKRKLAPKNLSRTLEDAGTITSPLIPWNTCGAFMASTLGVPTVAYLPYAFFNLMNPIIAMIYGYTGFSIVKLDDEGEEITG
ncbi:MAG: Na+/H+ antiporter NhaC [Rhodothermales bacterium]